LHSGERTARAFREDGICFDLDGGIEFCGLCGLFGFDGGIGPNSRKIRLGRHHIYLVHARGSGRFALRVIKQYLAENEKQNTKKLKSTSFG
jgi:hypothetical protein